MVKWDDICWVSVIVTYRMQFATAYLYVRDHISSSIVTTLPYWARLDLSDSSGSSGGKFAIRIFFVPIPAIAVLIIEISPLLCLYSAFHHKSRSKNACPPVLCKLAVSGRRSGTCSPSFRGSVGCHGFIRGCHKL